MDQPLLLIFRTLALAGIALGMGLLFNAVRPDRIPLVATQEWITPQALAQGEISLAKATRLFFAKEVIFLDARDADAYAQGHIEGALSLPFFAFEETFPGLQAALEKTTVITYCDGEMCRLSHDLADQMRARGLKNVYVLANGWKRWTAANLPIRVGFNP